jgi:phospholipid/cholesterol/gamma-HCH transport system permease protein
VSKETYRGEFSFKGPEAGGKVSLMGSLDAFSAPSPFLTKKKLRGLKSIVFDLTGITHLDLNGATFLLSETEALRARGIDSKVMGLSDRLSPIWELALKNFPKDASERTLPPPEDDTISFIGKGFFHFLTDLKNLVSFLGESLGYIFLCIIKPGNIRFATLLSLTERSVVNALPVTCLVAFLVGLILAFQSAMFMQIFGVDIFVADLVGIAMIRELGTLLTAIVLTGRSGSAISSELASMKSNQEIDAFVTMGLSPVRDLAVPRILALTFATPLLTILADLAGLIGGNIVMVSMGHPYMVFWEELSSHIDISDISTGLFKAFVFGFTVALIGCQRGLYAEKGPSAVGEATTLGVVTNIIAVAILDSLFAVLFYVLNW